MATIIDYGVWQRRCGDRNPAEWNIAIDKNTSRQRTRIDYPSVKAYRIEPTILSIGATRGEINFTDVRIYDRDRTICDVLRNMNKMDKELFNKAIQGYVNDPQKNVPNLIEYAKALRVWNKVKNLIECGCNAEYRCSNLKTNTYGTI